MSGVAWLRAPGLADSAAEAAEPLAVASVAVEPETAELVAVAAADAEPATAELVTVAAADAEPVTAEGDVVRLADAEPATAELVAVAAADAEPATAKLVTVAAADAEPVTAERDVVRLADGARLAESLPGQLPPVTPLGMWDGIDLPGVGDTGYGFAPVVVEKKPLLVRLLRLRQLRPTGWQRAAVGDLPILIAVLLVLGDLATAWTVLVLPAVVLGLVKFHDILESRLAPLPVAPPVGRPFGGTDPAS